MLQQLAPFFANSVTTPAPEPTPTFDPASYEQVASKVVISKLTAKGLPVFHSIYGYGFVPHTAIKAFFNPAKQMVAFASSKTKRLGGSIVVAKSALLVDHTHKTYPGFAAAVVAAKAKAKALAV